MISLHGKLRDNLAAALTTAAAGWDAPVTVLSQWVTRSELESQVKGRVYLTVAPGKRVISTEQRGGVNRAVVLQFTVQCKPRPGSVDADVDAALRIVEQLEEWLAADATEREGFRGQYFEDDELAEAALLPEAWDEFAQVTVVTPFRYQLVA